MKKYFVHFEILQGRKTKSGMLVPTNYDFWEPLLSHFIEKCTHFRIDCWLDEATAIARAKIFGKILDTGVDNLKVFTGEITEEFIFELIHNPFDDEGKIKWFSIFLIDADRYVFSVEHYGSEFTADCLTEEEVEYIRSIIPEDFNFHVYDKMENGKGKCL
jgi:hypothetical protein